MRFAKIASVISALVRSGYVAANRRHMFPPSEWPKSAVRSEPAASRTARTSSIRSSSVGNLSFGTRSESPVPRLSNRIRREKEASLPRNPAIPGSSHIASMFETQPGTYSRSMDPSPTTW